MFNPLRAREWNNEAARSLSTRCSEDKNASLPECLPLSCKLKFLWGIPYISRQLSFTKKYMTISIRQLEWLRSKFIPEPGIPVSFAGPVISLAPSGSDGWVSSLVWSRDGPVLDVTKAVRARTDLLCLWRTMLLGLWAEQGLPVKRSYPAPSITKRRRFSLCIYLRGESKTALLRINPLSWFESWEKQKGEKRKGK